MSEIHETVLKFRDFLSVSLPIVEPCFRGNMDDLFGDWLQSNWEIIVESKMGKYILHYGDGADCNGLSNRVWQAEIVPTHRVACKDLKTGIIYGFHEFVHWNGSSCSYDTPLNYILCSYDPFTVIEIVNIEFVLAEI